MSKNYIDLSTIEFDFFNDCKFENKNNLSITECTNAIIQPFKVINENGSILYPRFGGVFNDNLQIIENSKLIWQNPFTQTKPVCSLGALDNSELDKIEYVDEDVVYLGHLDSHFGHFLVDSTTRLWIFFDEEFKDKKAVYISDGQDAYIDIFYLFGLKKENLIRIDKPTRFKKVIVPEPSFRFHFSYHEKYKKFFEHVSNNVKGKSYKKIYLSRRKLRGCKCYGEDTIEKIFKNNGYKVIYPEQLSLTKQISFMKNATHIAGIAGSACHLSLFAKDGINICVINRNKGNFITQLFINKIKNFNASFIDAFVNPLPVAPYGTPYLIGLNKNLREFFYDNNFKFNKKLPIISKKDFTDFIFAWAKTVTNLDCENIPLKELADKIKRIEEGINE